MQLFVNKVICTPVKNGFARNMAVLRGVLIKFAPPDSVTFVKTQSQDAQPGCQEYILGVRPGSVNFEPV